MTIDLKENRLRKLSLGTNKKLGLFFTAGFPKLNDTLAIAKILERAGADFIEIGIPFSDSLVDGPVIQECNSVALQNGFNVKELFKQLENLRPAITIPVVLMGGLNPVLQYGIEHFCQQCKQVGIDGLILPEMPLNEYRNRYRSLFADANLANILLAAPNSTDERIKEIDSLANGFIYLVSAAGTTGELFSSRSIGSEYLEHISKLNLTNPTMVGFGIRDRDSFLAASKYSSGGIVGSQLLRVIQQHGLDEQAISKFIKELKA